MLTKEQIRGAACAQLANAKPPHVDTKLSALAHELWAMAQGTAPIEDAVIPMVAALRAFAQDMAAVDVGSNDGLGALRAESFVILSRLQSGTEDVVRLDAALAAVAAERERCARACEGEAGRWLVWCPERGQDKEDGMRVMATYAESAAVTWAERDDADSAEYSIVSGNDATVMVAEDREGAPEECFVLSGESSPVYRARQRARDTRKRKLPGVDPTDRELTAFALGVEVAEASSERRAITFGDLMHHQILAMRAAVVDGHLRSPEHGLQWIVNTLEGPGHLPNLDEARAIGGAQALFDKEVAEQEAFRTAHPAPGA